MFLASSSWTPSPSFERPGLGAVVGLEPADRLVGGQGVLLPLGQDDDPEVADVPLERPEPGVGVLHQLVVDAHRRAEVARSS